METSANGKTEVEVVDGVQYDKGLTNSHFVTNPQSKTAELENPLVLLIESPVDTIRQIQSVLEYVIKNNKPLLVIGDLDQGVLSALAMNKMKGNIKVNVIDAPTFGISKKEVLDDLSLLTGATIINEDLGDDMDMIQVEHLGSCLKSVTSHNDTVIQVKESSQEILDIIEGIKSELAQGDLQAYQVIKLEKRLAMLAAKIAIVKIGANSDIELKEKTDRVEDAICATKAAIKEGIVPGGGIALLNASDYIVAKTEGETVLLEAIKAPFKTILNNAGINNYTVPKGRGKGLNVVTGKMVNMIKSGIIDPLLVTKSALKNAASVATTILSTDCVINNLRIDESGR
jgi:chaperonin GroEL